MKDAVLKHLVELVAEELKHEIDPAKRGDLEKKALILRFLPRREFTTVDEIVPSSFVELELETPAKPRFYALIIPTGGGWIAEWNGKPLQILTPHSPLGEMLVGRRAGDSFELTTYQGQARAYRVLSHI